MSAASHHGTLMPSVARSAAAFIPTRTHSAGPPKNSAAIKYRLAANSEITQPTREQHIDSCNSIPSLL
jgi:hypothetical protein